MSSQVESGRWKLVTDSPTDHDADGSITIVPKGGGTLFMRDVARQAVETSKIIVEQLIIPSVETLSEDEQTALTSWLAERPTDAVALEFEVAGASTIVQNLRDLGWAAYTLSMEEGQDGFDPPERARHLEMVAGDIGDIALDSHPRL